MKTWNWGLRIENKVKNTNVDVYTMLLSDTSSHTVASNTQTGSKLEFSEELNWKTINISDIYVKFCHII